MLSVLASALALLFTAPRLYVAMSDDGLFPSALASVNPTTQAPARATAFLAVLASLLVFVGTFQQIVAFFMCTTLGFIALAAASLIVVRRARVGGIVFVARLSAHGGTVRPARPRRGRARGHQSSLQAFAGFANIVLGLLAHRVFATYHANG